MIGFWTATLSDLILGEEKKDVIGCWIFRLDGETRDIIGDDDDDVGWALRMGMGVRKLCFFNGGAC